MEPVIVNWFAVIAATLVGFVVGFIWYGPLFGKTWRREIGVSEEAAAQADRSGMGKIFGFTAVFQFLMAYCLVMFFGNEVTLVTGALYGFLAGCFWVALALAVNALYEQRSWTYILINGGYWSLVFTLMGAILGGWR